MSGGSSSSSSSDDDRESSKATAVTTSQTPPPSTSTSEPQSSASSSASVAKSSIQSLSSIISSIPSSLSSSPNPSFSLLHDTAISSQISSLLRQPDSGSGDNNLCRWLYDTFHSTDPNLQLVVLRFLPIIAGVYLTRISRRKSQLAGFEAILLALYAHETTARKGQPITVHVPDLSHSSIYHEAKPSIKNNATELNLAVISSSLEPHGTMRSTRRARIVGVALELYYSKISQIPITSKIEFCEFCEIWAGQDINCIINQEDDGNNNKEKKKRENSIAMGIIAANVEDY